ncbi:MAG TPA: globin domain-containing protein [Acidimicrobiales bacterium]|nr:globin domain-containing protein [Acidimicrobiales bacterium]
MTPDQITTMETTLALLGPAIDEVAADFYGRVLAAAPETADLFTGDLAAQHRKFARELDAIVAAIRDHDAFADRTARLGSRHVRYGVRPAHYDVVGPALLDALAAALGSAWTNEAAEAWRLGYRLTAEAMMQAAEAEAPASAVH